MSGIYGWRDMRAEIIERIVADMRTVIADPAFRARVESVGTVPRTGSPEEFAAAIEDQRARIAAIHQAKPAQ